MQKLLFVAALAVLLISAAVALADSVTTISPAQTSIALAPGQEIDLPINVDNAQNWYGIDLRLYYNPAIVQVISVTRGTIPQPDFVLWERFDNRVGTAYYVTTQLNPTLPISGSGTIVTVRLRGVIAGQTPLIVWAQVANRDGFEIPVKIVSGAALVSMASPLPTPIGLERRFFLPTIWQ